MVRQEGHSYTVAAASPNKQDLITKVSTVSATKIVGSLAEVLRREESNGVRRYIVGIGDGKGMRAARIIKNVPHDRANFDGANGPVEALDTNGAGTRRDEEVGQAIGDAGRGTAVDKDVKGIRVEDRLADAGRGSRSGISQAGSKDGLREKRHARERARMHTRAHGQATP